MIHNVYKSVTSTCGPRRTLNRNQLSATFVLVLLSTSFLPLMTNLIPAVHATSPTIPSGITSYVPVTLTNSQGSATPAPFQQMVQVDSTTYSTYEAANLQNVEFFDSSGAIVPSWLESGNSNAATNTIYWLEIAGGIPASSSITVYMGFASLTTNLFNSLTAGEAPQLSATYGQYDDGGIVFTNYWNFAGTSLPSPWGEYHGGASGFYSVSNGLTVSTTGTYGDWIAVETTSTYNPETQVADVLVQSNCLASCAAITDGAYSFSLVTLIPQSNTGASAQTGTGAAATLDSAGNYAIWTGPWAYSEMTPATALNANWNVLTVYETPSTGCGALDYTVASLCSGSNFTPSTSSHILFNAAGVAGQTDHVGWVRLRSQPPSGVMPTVSLGSDTTPPSASGNLITNPGFENGLAGWSTSQGSAVYSADLTTQNSGSYSAKGVETSTGSLGRLYQDVTGITSPGSQYQISGWIKTSSVVGEAVIGLDYVASSGWTPADGYVKEIGYVSGTQGWTHFRRLHLYASRHAFGCPTSMVPF